MHDVAPTATTTDSSALVGRRRIHDEAHRDDERHRAALCRGVSHTPTSVGNGDQGAPAGYLLVPQARVERVA
jgi:hypothetical protein